MTDGDLEVIAPTNEDLADRFPCRWREARHDDVRLNGMDPARPNRCRIETETDRRHHCGGRRSAELRVTALLAITDHIGSVFIGKGAPVFDCGVRREGERGVVEADIMGVVHFGCHGDPAKV